MKQINQFINEYIVKKKLDKFIDSEDHYDYCPKTKEELIDNIKELFDKGETNLNCIDTSNITDMSRLFDKYENKNFDVSGWNVSKVKDMYCMFYGCESFDCDLSKWDVSEVTTMYAMFEGCDKFKGDGLENWNVSKVKHINYMFMGCENFDADLSKWDVSNVTNMNYMFYKCKNFNCDLSNWNVNNTKTTTDGMFSYCTSLKNKPSWYKE